MLRFFLKLGVRRLDHVTGHTHYVLLCANQYLELGYTIHPEVIEDTRGFILLIKRRQVGNVIWPITP